MKKTGQWCNEMMKYVIQLLLINNEPKYDNSENEWQWPNENDNVKTSDNGQWNDEMKIQ